MGCTRPTDIAAFHVRASGVRAVLLVCQAHYLYTLCVQYHILRNKGTEPAGTGEYNKLYDDGTYKCGGCGTPLYK